MYNMECPICYEDLKTKIHFPFKCNHRICLDCNEHLENRICPMCRAEIPILIKKHEYIIFMVGIFFPPLLTNFLFK